MARGESLASIRGRVEVRYTNASDCCERLEDEGWSVSTAGNGVEALHKMRSATDDVVLLHLMMPVLELLKLS